jgi:hypothetical protein
MREISSKEFANMVEDKITNDIEARLYVTYNALAETFGFPRIVGELAEERFSELFADGYAAEMRDIAIRFFEEFGMPVKSDGRDF